MQPAARMCTTCTCPVAALRGHSILWVITTTDGNADWANGDWSSESSTTAHRLDPWKCSAAEQLDGIASRLKTEADWRTSRAAGRQSLLSPACRAPWHRSASETRGTHRDIA